MFDSFESNFSPDFKEASRKDSMIPISPDLALSELINRFGGLSFENGLYRIIRDTDYDDWKNRVSFTFPQFADRISCFGYDWLGRVFAVDSKRFEQGAPGVVMFEPGTAEVLEIPANIETFHDEELIEYGEAALARDFHEQWLSSGGAKPGYLQCVGYKIPLFLGGADTVENLILSDLDVYWHIMGQLIIKARG